MATATRASDSRATPEGGDLGPQRGGHGPSCTYTAQCTGGRTLRVRGLRIAGAQRSRPRLATYRAQESVVRPASGSWGCVVYRGWSCNGSRMWIWILTWIWSQLSSGPRPLLLELRAVLVAPPARPRPRLISGSWLLSRFPGQTTARQHHSNYMLSYDSASSRSLSPWLSRVLTPLSERRDGRVPTFTSNAQVQSARGCQNPRDRLAVAVAAPDYK